MKYLLLLAVLAGALWLWMGRPRPRVPPAPRRKGAPEDMVQCAHCGLHLPRSEALPGKGGLFCDAQHRNAFHQSSPE